MSKAACHSDGVESSNPCHCRGERLHHHGGGAFLVIRVVVDRLVMSRAHRM
jgi:hypothetical protein